MRKVFLDDLPRRGEGTRKNSISWNASVGKTINFIYDEIKGQLEITSYIKEKSRLELLYRNEKFHIFTGHLRECKIQGILGLKTRKYQFDIDDIVPVKNGAIKIVNQIRKNGGKAYEYICLKCENSSTIEEHSLKNKSGCPICTNRVVQKGVNDMWTTNPELASLLRYPDDGYKFTKGSNKRVDWKCPNCSSIIRNKIIASVNSKGLSCKKCSDGVSYPEKMIFNVLEQLGCEFETQKQFKWLVDRKYDFYIEKLNCIIEVHGEQHYKESSRGRSLREEIANDAHKKKAALKNGVSQYIVIDARKSDVNFIKESIMNSGICDMIDLSMVDWIKCEEFASNSFVKIVCDLWNSGVHSPKLIAEKTNLGRSTVGRYLAQGKRINWCNYSIEKACAEGYKIRLKKPKEVVQLSKDNTFIFSYDSIKEAASKLEINRSHISCCCTGKRKSTGGYKWMYKEDYDKYIEEKNNKEIV